MHAIVVRDASHSSRTIAAFAAIYVLWGSTYLAVGIGVESIPPFLLMAMRSLAAGAMLLAIERLRAPIRLPAGTWVNAAMGGVLLFAGCHGTLAYAQQYVPTGVAAVVLATIPFWIALLNLLPSQRRPTAWTLIGLVPGLAGVALVTWKTDEQAADPSWLPYCLVRLFPGQRVPSLRSGKAIGRMRLPSRECSSSLAAPSCLQSAR